MFSALELGMVVDVVVVVVVLVVVLVAELVVAGVDLASKISLTAVLVTRMGFFDRDCRLFSRHLQ